MKPSRTPGGTDESTEGRRTTWCFDVTDVQMVEGLLRAATLRAGLDLQRQGDIQSEDAWFDSADWRIHRAGYCFSTNTTRERIEARLEATSNGRSGPDRRFREALPEQFGAAVLAAPGPVGRRLRAVLGGSDLSGLFRFDRLERRFVIRQHGRVLAEAQICESVICTPAREEIGRLRRVVVQVLSPTYDQVQAIVRDLASAACLAPTSTSDFEVGLLAASLTPSPRPGRDNPPLDPSLPTAEAAHALLCASGRTFLHHEPGARLDGNAEALLEMREAGRRLRTALELFSDHLAPELMELGPELDWVGASLSTVRTMGIQLELLSPEPDGIQTAGESLEALAGMLLRQHATARERLLGALDSPRFAALEDRLRALLAGRPDGAGDPIGRAAPRLMRERFHLLRDLGDELTASSDPTDFHVLRMHAEGLFHTIEFFESMYGEPARGLLRELGRLEDLLGRHQDACLAINHIRSMVERDGGAPPPATCFALGVIAERLHRRVRKARRGFGQRFLAVTGKRWRKLNLAL